MSTDMWLAETNTPVVGSSNDLNYKSSRHVGGVNLGVGASLQSLAHGANTVQSSNDKIWTKEMFDEAQRKNGGGTAQDLGRPVTLPRHVD